MSTQNPRQNDSRTLRAASMQFESLPGDKDANFRKLEAFTEQAAAQGVRLIVFPECCITGYWFIRNLTVAQLAALAEPIPDGPSTRRLIALARKHRITIGAGLVEATGGGVFHNSYIVALPDGTVHRHRIRRLKAPAHATARHQSSMNIPSRAPCGNRGLQPVCRLPHLHPQGRNNTRAFSAHAARKRHWNLRPHPNSDGTGGGSRAAVPAVSVRCALAAPDTLTREVPHLERGFLVRRAGALGPEPRMKRRRLR